ncbi:hypothetical protein R3P38DRAFT_3258370 [Favolaschia claudopus]|uniref:Uncharacterized protein n=1 Tax=Favolaschia claudopus TaxID=2862362 RepID=A0AAW0D9F6_9AGAR
MSATSFRTTPTTRETTSPSTLLLRSPLLPSADNPLPSPLKEPCAARARAAYTYNYTHTIPTHAPSAPPIHALPIDMGVFSKPRPHSPPPQSASTSPPPYLPWPPSSSRLPLSPPPPRPPTGLCTSTPLPLIPKNTSTRTWQCKPKKSAPSTTTISAWSSPPSRHLPPRIPEIHLPTHPPPKKTRTTKTKTASPPSRSRHSSTGLRSSASGKGGNRGRRFSYYGGSAFSCAGGVRVCLRV